MKEIPNETHNSLNLMYVIAKKWKLLIIIFVVSGIIALLLSSLIKPRFKSTAVIYAPRTNSVSKSLIDNSDNNERLDIKAYAIEAETEQMMELLGAREIKDALIRKYHLLEHYHLDSTSKYWQSKLYKYITNNYTVKRTKFGAITISIEDQDPQFAYNMTNEVLLQIDSLKWRMENERALAAQLALQEQLEEVTAEINKVDDSIQVIMKHGVYDFKTQSERVMQQYAIAIAQGNTAGIQRLEAELEKLSTWGARSKALEDLQYNFRNYQSTVKQKLLENKMDIDNAIPTKFVVEYPIVADKKCYPNKTIFSLLIAFSTTILTLLILLVKERLQTPIMEQKKLYNE